MTTISYASASTPVRADLVEAHQQLWQKLAEPGAWWTGAERVAIAAEVRKAWTCTLCTDRKAALSPSAVTGEHDNTHGVLPSAVVEMIHRVTTDPGRLSKDWYERLVADGVEDTHYIEALGVVVRTVSVDSFCRGVGILPHPLPTYTVIFKPSEETPLSGQAYADILNEKLPRDVLITVHGADDQGKRLVESDVDLIAFTGSRETGKHILRVASGGLKRVILELGGKDPMIVLESADLEKAARFAAFNSFRNAGQVCVSTERIFVPEVIAERFEALLVEATASLTQGDGLDEGVKVGPMVNVSQRSHVLTQLEAAVSEGAEVLAGGSGHHDNFVTPTVLTGVTDAMSIATEETFGPVACVTRVESVDEAVQKANATHFGLGAVVFGEDGERTTRVARQLTAGMIGINKAVHGARGAPWVGARQSGFGFHKSKDGHRQFTQTRVVTRRA